MIVLYKTEIFFQKWRMCRVRCDGERMKWNFCIDIEEGERKNEKIFFSWLIVNWIFLISFPPKSKIDDRLNKSTRFLFASNDDQISRFSRLRESSFSLQIQNKCFLSIRNREEEEEEENISSMRIHCAFLLLLLLIIHSIIKPMKMKNKQIVRYFQLAN